MKFWRLLDNFGYYDYAEIQKDEERKEEVSCILGESSKALSIVMQVFA